MFKLQAQKGRILATGPNGQFPKLFEIPALRVLRPDELQRLIHRTKRLPVVGRLPDEQVVS